MHFVFAALAWLSNLGVLPVSQGESWLNDAFESSALAAEPSKLGDLSKFRRIAVDVRVFAEKSDLAGGKKRIKDLETLWDDAEAGLKPRAGKDWRKLDKAIDAALEAFRESKPNQAGCKKATDGVIAAIDELS